MIWSFSNGRLFNQCQRQWFYKTHVANANAKKDPLRREAFLLSKLQSVSAWRGQVVDLVIERQVVPTLKSKRPLDYNALKLYARTIFDSQLEFAKQHRLRDQGMVISQIGDAFAAFYEIEYSNGVSDSEINQAWLEVEMALSHLCEMQDLITSLGAASWLIPQRALMFNFDQHTVRAVPDLIAFFRNKPPLIVDWKVHAFGSSDYRLQLACYAIALVRCDPHKDFPPSLSRIAPTNIQLMEIQLLTNQQREYTLTDDDLEATEAYIAGNLRDMILATGDSQNEKLSPFDFPVTSNPYTCQRCPFRSLCWEAVQ